jgi:hypothetical protein
LCCIIRFSIPPEDFPRSAVRHERLQEIDKTWVKQETNTVGNQVDVNQICAAVAN